MTITTWIRGKDEYKRRKKNKKVEYGDHFDSAKVILISLHMLIRILYCGFDT